MKLASQFEPGTRDGVLIVVSRDLQRYVPARDVVPTLQAALDDWTHLAPQLEAISGRLNADPSLGQPFEPPMCVSPLPRAYQWVDGSAYVNHVELVRKARGAVLPPEFWTDPLVYQGGSDDFNAPHGPILCRDSAWGIDLEAEVAVITNDVPMGTPEAEASQYIKLVMLVNDVSLRNLIPAELGKGFGFYQSKPATTFSPVAVTPDELGAAWVDCKVHLPLISHINGSMFGMPNAGIDMTFSFSQLIAHVTKTRRLGAGTIIGSGTVSNRDADGGPGKSIAAGGLGYSCIAEVRMIETILSGAPVTPFLQQGDHVRIEMLDDKNQSIFGAIEQSVQIGD